MQKQSNEEYTDTPSSPVTPRSRRKAILAKASTGILFVYYQSFWLH